MTEAWPVGKKYVTHHELDLWGGEVMRQLNDIRENMLTKQDTENFLTKEDAKNFLTKEDAKNFLTRKDAQRFATKEDIERLFLMLDEIRENTKK